MLSDPEKYIIKLDREIVTKLGLAIWLADDYLPSQSPLGPIQLFIKDFKLEAIRNLSGYYLFLNLPDSTYTIQVKTLFYFDQEFDIAIPRILNNNDYVLDERIESGSKEAVLNTTTRLRDGDVVQFFANNRAPERRWITLDTNDATKIIWKKDLRGGLEFAYDADTPILIPEIEQQKRSIRVDLKPKSNYPFPGNATLLRGILKNNDAVDGAMISIQNKNTSTISDENGEFVLYFTEIREDENGKKIPEPVTLEISKGNDTMDIEAEIFPEKTIYLGVIKFP